MKVYTVTKPGGAKDQEMVAHTKLLEDIGINVSNAPRVAEPGTNRLWLYAWKSKEAAARFASGLQTRTRDKTWNVYEIEIDTESTGPVAPIDICSIREPGGYSYYVERASRERIVIAFHYARPIGDFFVSNETQNEILHDWAKTWWPNVGNKLTTLEKQQIVELGGYRVFTPEGQVWHEELPQAQPALV